MSRHPEPRLRSDEDLVAACRHGEAWAWRELVSRYRRLVYGIPLALGLQPADADEVFQHTFVELLRALPRIREPHRLEAWLVTTSRRAALRLKIDERRRGRTAERSLAESSAESAPAADARIESLREGEQLMRALDVVGDPCRALLVGLFSDPAASYQTLARRLKLAVGSLGATRARCLERLRRELRRLRAGLSAREVGATPTRGRS